jgi:hypothetical protein
MRDIAEDEKISDEQLAAELVVKGLEKGCSRRGKPWIEPRRSRKSAEV